MLELRIEELNNGYIVYTLPEQQGYRSKAQHVATNIQALGLLVKQLAGAEKHEQCQAKRKHK
jgi:hypothetical protein